MLPKVAVVGCGYWGKNLIRNLSELGVLHSIADHHLDRAQILSEQFSVTILDFDSILKSECDAVFIATQSATHFELAKECLNADKHIFVEKPLTISLSESIFLNDLAKRKNKKIMVGHILNYHPVFQKMKSLIENDQIGSVQYIYANRLNFNTFRKNESVLWDLGPHDISVILSLVKSEPQNIFATGTSLLNSKNYDTVNLNIIFENNINATIFLSWNHPKKEQKFVVVGSKGMVIFDDLLIHEEKLFIKKYSNSLAKEMPNFENIQEQNISVLKNEPLKKECKHFIECITENLDPITNGDESIRVLKIIDAAERSIQQQSNIKL
jgi:UDP-2-acetamido-3-amino-2,3-dideoxy-glucuronate N-acetyltransferase